MIRTPYGPGRPSRSRACPAAHHARGPRLATVGAALVLVAALAGCGRLNPSASPTESATSSPTETPNTSPNTSPSPTATVTATPTLTESDATPLGPLSGTWEGTWVNTTPTAAIGTFTLIWAQQDDKLFGALTVAGSNCLTAGNVTGEIVGKGVSFGAVEANTTIEYTGTIVDDNTIEGTYESDCGDSAGTWTATRTTS
jgi:hypothetical protein